MYDVALATGLLTPEHLQFREAMARLAEEAVAPTRAERARARRFDRDLWRRLAAAGFTGVLVPEDQGGTGRDARSLLLALEAMVEHGQDLGLGVSLNIHNQVVSNLFLPYATDAQRERYLPRLLNGESLICLAVSEPETGAHPRHLKTRAELEGDTYFLTGQKAYITNGPESDLLIVIAVTDDTGPLRGISAFIVERDWPGVEISPPMDLGFLETSPHAQVQLERCAVPAGNLIGPKDTAYRGMVRNFRDHEDTFGCGLFSGLLAWQLNETLAGPPGASAATGGEEATPIAQAQSALAAARLLGLTIVALRDAGVEGEDSVGALLDAAHDACRRGGEAIAAAWENCPADDDAPISVARREAGLGSIAGRVRAIRRAQRGARLAGAGRGNA